MAVHSSHLSHRGLWFFRDFWLRGAEREGYAAFLWWCSLRVGLKDDAVHLKKIKEDKKKEEKTKN